MANERNQYLRTAYDFFASRSATGAQFTLTELSQATGWKLATVRTYPKKQWDEILEKLGPETFKVKPEFKRFSFEVFRALNSQKQSVNKDPFKPILARNVEQLVTKARESALIAVQIFNNPTMEFRTPSFLVHMVIAWSSLFHATFERDGIEYWYKEKDGTDQIRDGDKLYWDLARCTQQHFRGRTCGERSNLELFVKLRNRVEHRFAPQFDLDFSSECQACLLNFERFLVENFGDYFSIGARVSIPLQLSRTSSKAKVTALRELHRGDYEVLKESLEVYRAALDPGIYGSPDYAFRVFLVPKPASSPSASDTSMEFINPEDLSPEDLGNIQSQITLIKSKQVPIVNKGLMKPGKVVKLVQEVEPRFNMHEHTLAWKRFKARPLDSSKSVLTNPDWCIYDDANSQYLYTPAWVEKLKELCTDPNALDKLRTKKPK